MALSSTGRELLRLERERLADVRRRATAPPPAEWRQALGAAEALRRLGAAGCGAEGMREACGREEHRELVRETLERSSRPLQSSSELTASLLRSSDWRQQLGALESPGAEHVALVAACCVGRAELRPAAARALRRLPGGARALAEALAGQEDREALELLLELAGGAREAYGLLPCGRFEDMVRRLDEQELEAQRLEEERLEAAERLREQQSELQMAQLQWLELLPAKQVAEMEIVSEVPKEKTQALKRRSRRSARPQRAGSELSPMPTRAGPADRWVEESAARLRRASEMQKMSPEELQEQAPELLAWLQAEHEDGVTAYLRRVAAELLGHVGSAGSALVAQLGASDAELRKRAVQSLGRLGQHLAAVAGCLADADGGVRRAAARALATGPVALCAAELPRPESRGAAARALRGREAELLTWAEQLVDQEPDTAPAVTATLQRLEAAGRTLQEQTTAREAHSKAVLAALRDPCEEKRLEALGRLEASTLTAALAERLTRSMADEPAVVRQRLVELLRAAPPEALEGALPAARALLAHGTQSVRRSAVAVADLRPAAAERHLALLGDEDATLRCQAVEALRRERLRPPERARLMALSIDPHWAVRLALAESLRSLTADERRLHENQVKLLRADSDWRVRRAARCA